MPGHENTFAGAGGDPATGRAVGAGGEDAVTIGSDAGGREYKASGPGTSSRQESVNTRKLRVRNAEDSSGITVPAEVFCQVGLFLPSRQRMQLSNVHSSIRAYASGINRSALQASFPDQYDRLVKKHKNATDDRWVTDEFKALYQEHYALQGYDGIQKRDRRLTGYVRGLIGAKVDRFETFFAFEPSLSELLSIVDPVSEEPLVMLMRQMSREWLNQVYQLVVIKHFRCSENSEGLDANKRGPWNSTVLYWAALCGQTNEVTVLLASNEYDVNAACRNTGVTALHLAAWEGHLDVVNALLKAGADVNAARTDDGSTALYAVAWEGHLDVVNALLKAGADVNAARTDTGSTALYTAAFKGHLDVVNALLKAGADVNAARTDTGSTALHLAAFKGHLDVVNALLKAGVNVNAARTDTGSTALHLAAFKGHLDVVNALLKAGADVNAARTDDGSTALHQAAWEGHLDVVNALLKAGADVNAARTDDGSTALHQAAATGRLDIVEALLGAGASVNAANMEGQSILYAAYECGDRMVIQKIKAALAVDETLARSRCCRIM